MMESIGKLRELCAKWRKTSITPGRNSAADEVDAIADEIEREIEDKIDDLMATSVDGYLREEIVRCRDCKHYTYADAEHGNNDWCAKHEHIAWSINGFCAWGERQ